MLDSFDKGASEDIHKSKIELYDRITWNKEKQCSMQSLGRRLPPSPNQRASHSVVVFPGSITVPTPPSSPSRGLAERMAAGIAEQSGGSVNFDALEQSPSESEFRPSTNGL